MQPFIAGSITVLAVLTFSLAVPKPALAAFHLYDITEVFSNADGSLQFVELFTTNNNQQSLSTHTIVASQGASTNTFPFLVAGPSPTANTSLLIATAAFEEACGIAPDFILPDNFLFDPDGMVDFGEGTDVIGYSTLPLDGETSLSYPGETSGTNSPTNWAGESCSLEAPVQTPALTPLGLAILATLVGTTGLVLGKRGSS